MKYQKIKVESDIDEMHNNSSSANSPKDPNIADEDSKINSNPAYSLRKKDSNISYTKVKVDHTIIGEDCKKKSKKHSYNGHEQSNYIDFEEDLDFL